jgi:hypothetical protein
MPAAGAGLYVMDLRSVYGPGVRLIAALVAAVFSRLAQVSLVA